MAKDQRLLVSLNLLAAPYPLWHSQALSQESAVNCPYRVHGIESGSNPDREACKEGPPQPGLQGGAHRTVRESFSWPPHTC